MLKDKQNVRLSTGTVPQVLCLSTPHTSKQQQLLGLERNTARREEHAPPDPIPYAHNASPEATPNGGALCTDSHPQSRTNGENSLLTLHSALCLEPIHK